MKGTVEHMTWYSFKWELTTRVEKRCCFDVGNAMITDTTIVILMTIWSLTEESKDEVTFFPFGAVGAGVRTISMGKYGTRVIWWCKLKIVHIVRSSYSTDVTCCFLEVRGNSVVQCSIQLVAWPFQRSCETLDHPCYAIHPVRHRWTLPGFD